MLMLLQVLIAVTILLTPNATHSRDLLLEWTEEIGAGAGQQDVKFYLELRGIRPIIIANGFTYTSKIATPDRDYLFCNDHLFSIVEGERVDEGQFNFWMTTFLEAHAAYGDPAETEIDQTWRQIVFRWKLSQDTTLIFLVRGAPPDTVIWSRELRHEPSSLPCR